jgi:hypothetical protein
MRMSGLNLLAEKPYFNDNLMMPAAVGIPSRLRGAKSLSEPPGNLWEGFRREWRR